MKESAYKKGQSNIITTVLLVLVALAAVAIVSVFIINMVRTNTQEAEIMSRVSEIKVEHVTLVPDLSLAKVKVKNNGGENNAEQIRIVLMDENGQTQTATLNAKIGGLESKILTIPLGSHMGKIISVQLYPIVNIGGNLKMAPKSDDFKQGLVTLGDPGQELTEEERNSLVLYLGGDEFMQSGYGENFQVVGNVTQEKGKLGNAYKFDGTGDYISINDSNALDVTKNATISVWINKNSFATEQKVLAKCNYFLNGFDIVTNNASSGSVYFRIASNGAGQVGCSNMNNHVNQWVNFIYVKNSTTVSVYRNNVLCQSSNYGGPIIVNDQPLYIGRACDSSSAWQFNGLIDEVLIYNRSLSASEVQKLYQLQNVN